MLVKVVPLLVVAASAFALVPAGHANTGPLEQEGTLTISTFGTGQALALVISGRTGLTGQLYDVVNGVQAGTDFHVLATTPNAMFEVAFPCADFYAPGPQQAGTVPCSGTALVFMIAGEPGSGYHYFEA